MTSLFKASIDGFTPLTSANDEVQRKVLLRDELSQLIDNKEAIRKATSNKLLLLKVNFRLFSKSTERGRKDKDLDNLLKIFCDVLAVNMDNATPPKERGLGLIDSDNSIVEIHCKKSFVESESNEGIDFEIFDAASTILPKYFWDY